VKTAMKLEISRNRVIDSTAVKSVASQDGFLSVEFKQICLTPDFMFLVLDRLRDIYCAPGYYVIWATLLYFSLQ
jgi:hypothetical protein